MHFSKSQALRLETLLDQAKFPEVLNYQECHGFLCGLIAGPVDLEPDQRNLSIFFGDEASDLKNIPEEAIQLIFLLHQEIANTFFSAETLLLPCTLQLDDDGVSVSLEDWVLGFFEAHMLNESSWYKVNEDMAAEMLMPFFLCLDEIEEAEIIAIKQDKALYQKLISQIPQALQDLYLYFHVNDG